MNWAPEEIAILKLYWPTHTAKVIAQMVSKSRNAVVGKAHRLRLPHKTTGYRGVRPHYPRDRAKSGSGVIDEPERR